MAEKGFFMDDWLKKFERYLIVERNGSEHTAAAYIRDIRQFFKLVFDDEEFSDYGAVDRDNARLLVIKLFDENNCDIGFCACRSKGKAVRQLKNKYSGNIEFYKKAEIKNAVNYKNINDWIDTLNDWQAEELLKRI